MAHPSAATLAKLAQARGQFATLRAARVNAEMAMASAGTRSSVERAALGAAVTNAREKEGVARAAVLANLGAAVVGDPADELAGMSTTYPIALLPARVETRYTADLGRLQIRVFPDDLLAETLEERLSPPEAAALGAYRAATADPAIEATQRTEAAAAARARRLDQEWAELVTRFQAAGGAPATAWAVALARHRLGPGVHYDVRRAPGVPSLPGDALTSAEKAWAKSYWHASAADQKKAWTAVAAARAGRAAWVLWETRPAGTKSLDFAPTIGELQAWRQEVPPALLSAATQFWRADEARETSDTAEIAAWLAAQREAWPSREEAAWARLTEAVGSAARAAWLLVAPDPRSTRPVGYQGPVEARCLPDRWIAVGYVKDPATDALKEAFVVPSRPISEPLPLTTDAYRSEDLSGVDADAAAWTVSFSAALSVGMAIEVKASDYTGSVAPSKFKSGLDLLIVIGVKSSWNAAESATALGDLLRKHRYTRGLALVKQGTPTNNTRGTASGWADDWRDGAFRAERGLDVVATDTDGARLLTALGIAPSTLAGLTAQDGASEDIAARNLFIAMWPAGIGFALSQLLGLSGNALAAPLLHGLMYVRGRGPYSAFRVGDVPYGLLPVGSLDLWKDDAESLQHLATVLRRLRPAWSRAVPFGPRVTTGGGPDAFAEVLAQEGVSRRVVARPAWVGNWRQDATWPSALSDAMRAAVRGTSTSPANLLRSSPLLLSIFHDVYGTLDAAAVEFATRPWHWVEPHDKSNPVRLPIADLSGVTAAGHPAFTSGVHAWLTAVKAMAADGHDHARFVEFLRAGSLVSAYLSKPQSLFRTLFLRAANQCFVDLLSSSPALGPTFPVLFAKAVRAPDGSSQLLERSDLSHLSEPEVERLTLETLDLSSHRLDAWITSLASRRLSRGRSVTPTGTYIGAVAWVEDLRPADASRAPEGGHIHAPSLDHAIAAAILRNGHLSTDDTARRKYAFELSSERVRRAQDLLEGVRRGQSLGTQVGYQIERDLHDQQLDELIAPLRRCFAPQAFAPDGEGTLTMTVGPGNVVDGEALVALSRSTDAAKNIDTPPLPQLLAPGELLNPGLIPWGQVVSAHTGAVFPTQEDERGLRLKTILANAADALDAVTDLLTAEAVYQGVRGRTDGLRAALDAMNRGGYPAEPEILRSPRPSHSVKHRFILSFSTSDVPPEQWALTARALAEPRLNAWVGRLLGPAGRYGCEVSDPAGEEPTSYVNLEDLAIAPLDLLDLAAGGSVDAIPDALRARVLRALPGGWDLRPRVVSARRAPASRQPLAVVLELARLAAELIGRSRPVVAQDFAPEDLRVAGTVEDLTPRYDAGRASIGRLVDGPDGLGEIVEAIASPVTALLREETVESLEAILWQAAEFGPWAPVPEVVAAARGPEGTVEQTASKLLAHQALVALAQAAIAGIEARTRAAASLADGGETAAALRALFGESLLVLQPFALPATADFLRDTGDFRPWSTRAALGVRPLDGSRAPDHTGSLPTVARAELARWIFEAGRVRPPLDAWTALQRSAEAVAGRAVRRGDAAVRAALRAVQVPLSPDGPPVWVGGRGEHAAGSVSVVLQEVGGALDPESVAGLLVDAWTEAIPEPTVATGVAFHYEEGGTEAPQAILLAVPPGTSAATWRFSDLLATVRETIDLAKIRAVDLEAMARAGETDSTCAELARILPAIYLGEKNDPWCNLAPGWLRDLEALVDRNTVPTEG